MKPTYEELEKKIATLTSENEMTWIHNKSIMKTRDELQAQLLTMREALNKCKQLFLDENLEHEFVDEALHSPPTLALRRWEKMVRVVEAAKVWASLRDGESSVTAKFSWALTDKETQNLKKAIDELEGEANES